MSGSERYRPWRPLDGISDSLYLEGIHDDVEGLRLLLRGPDPTEPTLRVKFESVTAYRNINESYRNRTWETAATRGLPTLMTVENSQWIRWIVAESGGVLVAERLTHYAIYTEEDCVDVITEFPPDVDWPNG